MAVATLLKDAQSIAELVEFQARSNPESLAVAGEGERISYKELNGRANQMASALRRAGIGPEKLVGIYMGRSARTVVAILGILKAGGAYLPMDLAYPEERVNFILEDSQCEVLITEAEHRAKMGGYRGKVICLENGYEALAAESTADVAGEAERSTAAYVIYTSGSTGQPKGVIVTHHNVLRLFEATDRWFGFNRHDVWTLFHSFAFDFSVWELWGALFYGGTVVIVPHLTARNPAAFHDLVERHGATVLSQTPSAFRQFIWAEAHGATRAKLNLRYVIFGGEALELQSLRPWFDRHPPEAPLLVNMYGITETTVHVTYRPIRPGDLEANAGSVIGEPIPDLTIRLLDEDGNPVKPGTPGEIYVGGEGVARGYLNRPELTAQRFIEDPGSERVGGRLYRSGDLARQLPNGDLEYLGRIDHQVKIHGFRIELGEIEAVLHSHPGIRESVVICEDHAGDKRLIAYVVANGAPPGLSELREFAQRRLPAYMLPSRVISLESLPLTVNGKIDRRALPKPDDGRPELATEFAAPKSQEEKALADIWREVLGVDRVGLNDNFFELGGDSIRSIQVLARAQKNGLRLSLQNLFKHPTLAGLLSHQAEDADEGFDPGLAPFALIGESDRERLPDGIVDAYPIGKLQHGMIYHSDLDKESAIFHDVFSFRLNLPYRRETLQQAIGRLAARHSIFRTSFHSEGFSQPLQLVHQTVSIPFSEEDLRGQKEEDQRRRLVEWVETEKRNRFEWTEAPLMRLHVQRLSDQAFQFIVSFHHAIMDGWSLAMMLTELFRDYDGLARGEEMDIDAPQVTYRDFIQLENRTLEAETSREFWREKIKDAETQTLPRWPHRPRARAHEQTRGPEIHYPNTLLRALQELARDCGVPIRTVLLAAHCRVMKLLTGAADVMTGLVANGRPQCTDGERLIGLFLNTLPFRARIEGDTWRELIRKTFEIEQEIIPHRRMPLSEIQQMAGGQPLFETTFDFVQFHIYRDLPGYQDHTFLEDHYFEANNFNFFVTFMLDAEATELQMHFDYNPNEFPSAQIDAICEYYREALRAMAAAPDDSVDAVALLPKAERHRVLTEWNATETPLPSTSTPELIAKQVEQSPEGTALVFGSQRMTYRELWNRSEQIAAELRSKGVGPDSFVGIYLDRSPDLVAAALGIWLTGGAYVPLDPTYPSDRLAFMGRDAGLRAVITSESLESRAQALGSAERCILERISGKPQPEWEPVTGENLAYVIYTSGSTGKPKGVEIPHNALLNFLLAMREKPGLTKEDRFLAVTTLSFDIAGLELWLPLICGATIVLAGSDEARDPAALERLIAEEDITLMQATPATWGALTHAGWKGKPDLRILCGGEAMPRQLAKELAVRGKELWNLYGPTETTVWSTAAQVRAGEGPVPIGRPIANTEIHVLNASRQPVPIGCEGEIYIGGAGLARGYHHRPDLTAEKFVPHPFKEGARLYRTGDLGRYVPDPTSGEAGELLCLGRTDHQVKIRGFRIEIGEIELALEEHPGVRQAVVIARDDGSGSRALAAYWIAEDHGQANEETLRAFLSERLPGYMVPTAWRKVEEFPLTPNGKIDRRSLPDPVPTRAETAPIRLAPRTPYEAEVVEVWKRILRLPEASVTDDFFALGGHSLAAMRVVGELRSKYNVNVTLAGFLRAPTVEALAAEVERLAQKGPASGKEASSRAI